ncbi:MAG: PIN domain-containing protein [Chloroflexota bacterium]|nr:PIN domain-containing protein [Chloroflexota bacterium]
MRIAKTLSEADLVTTDAVFVEVLAFFAQAGPRARAQAAATVDEARSDPRTLVLPQTRELFDAGLDLYRSRLDKGYSLTDCMSTAICRQLDITDVLTHDEHFRQEGFSVLL